MTDERPRPGNAGLVRLIQPPFMLAGHLVTDPRDVMLLLLGDPRTTDQETLDAVAWWLAEVYASGRVAKP